MANEICYAVAGDVFFLKLSGELRHDNSAALGALCDSLFASGHTLKSAVIDLNALRFMDSTVIGMLAQIARALAEVGGKLAELYSTDPEINALLLNLRLDEVFTIIPDEAPAELLTALESGDACNSQVSAQGILRAHEALSEVHQDNADKFAEVVALLRQSSPDP